MMNFLGKGLGVTKRVKTVKPKVAKAVDEDKIVDKVKRIVTRKAVVEAAPLPVPPPIVAQPVVVTKLIRPNQFKPYMGCDPEFFFKVDKKIVGAELHIPKEGLKNTITRQGGLHTALTTMDTKFIIDGVQVELNPRPDTCRANLANEIAAAFRTLKAELDKKGDKVEMDFSRSIKITEGELKKLDPNNQKLGCMPSLNSHKGTECKLSKIDPLKHMQRSAGGHIHIGFKGYGNLENAIKKNPNEMVEMLDIICGNTCVLVDRDEGNIERRKLYGRAGEYRLPPHGLEYRTLSNFWLEHYYLFSFAFGIARLAVNLCAHDNSKQYIEAFKSKVDMQEVQDAINNNDFDLAYKNFKAIEPLLLQVLPEAYEDNGISVANMPQFHYFVKTVKEHGLKHWFTQDPVEHWCKLPEAHPTGFHHFLNGEVKQRMEKEKVA